MTLNHDRLAAPPTPRGSRLPPWMPLLVVAAAWAAQGGVLRNGWVWDDAILVRDGSAVARGWAAVPSMLTGTWGGGEGIERGLFRPLVGASLAIQAAIHGTADPFPFHLVNLFLHGLAAVLLLAVGHRLLPSRPAIASTAALLFAVSPLHTGTVSWIVARGDLLAAVFSLLAILAWTRPRGLDAAAAVLASVCTLLAILSKEAALPLPAVLLLVDAGARGEGVRTAIARRWTGYLALVGAVVVWFLLRLSAGGLGALHANAPLASRPAIERAFLAAGSLARMAWKIALPVGLSGDASNDPVLDRRADLPDAYGIVAVVVLLAVLALAVRAWNGKGGLVSFCLAAFTLLALPVIQIVPIGAVFEDRFAYLPSLALLPLAGLAVERLLATRARRAALAACAAVLAALVPAAWAVAADWHDDETFNRALLEDDPGHLAAADRLANHLLHEAQRARREAAALPTSSRARIDALAERQSALVGEAVRILERANGLPGGRAKSAIQVGLGDAYANLPSPRHDLEKDAYERWLGMKRVLEGGRYVALRDVRSIDRVAPEDRREVSRVYEALSIAQLALERDDGRTRAEYLDQAARWSPRSFSLARRAAAAWLEAADGARALPHLERAAALAEADGAASGEDQVWVMRTLLETRSKSEPGWGAFHRAEDANRRAGGHVEALALFRQALREKPDLFDAYFEIVKIERYKGNFRGVFDTLDACAKALDDAKTPADDPRRARIASLRTLYESERDVPEDPIASKIEAAKFARSKRAFDLALRGLEEAKKALDDAKAPADDPRRVETQALVEQYTKERDAADGAGK